MEERDNYIITSDVLFFFDGKPAALLLYKEFANRVLAEIDNVTVKVQKTQISFSNRRHFAFVSLLPVRRAKERPETYIAKEIDCRADIAVCHAIGQACAVVHTAGHAIGYPMYDLSAIVYRLGIEDCAEAVGLRKQAYIRKLFYWSAHVGEYEGTWADFMLK